MKKLAILVFFLSFSVNAQFVNGKPVSELKNDYKYLEVIPYIKGKQEVKYVQIFFGQAVGYRDLKKTIVYKTKLPQDEMKFINDASVLNFLYDNGYRLHTAFETSKKFIMERID